MAKRLRAREYRVVLSGTITAEFTIENQMAADTPEQAAVAFKRELKKKGFVIDPLSPKVKIGKLIARGLKSDSIEHTSGDPPNGTHT